MAPCIVEVCVGSVFYFRAFAIVSIFRQTLSKVSAHAQTNALMTLVDGIVSSYAGTNDTDISMPRSVSLRPVDNVYVVELVDADI